MSKTLQFSFHSSTMPATIQSACLALCCLHPSTIRSASWSVLSCTILNGPVPRSCDRKGLAAPTKVLWKPPSLKPVLLLVLGGVKRPSKPLPQQNARAHVVLKIVLGWVVSFETFSFQLQCWYAPPSVVQDQNVKWEKKILCLFFLFLFSQLSCWCIHNKMRSCVVRIIRQNAARQQASNGRRLPRKIFRFVKKEKVSTKWNA